jgi:IS4 transposase
MDGFQREVLDRLPLAQAVWTLLRYALDGEFLDRLFEQHRGLGSQRSVEFSLLATLVAEALLMHEGSGRRAFRAAQREERLNATTRAVYGKLGRIRLEISEAFLHEATARVSEALPETEDLSNIPPSLREFQILAFDGKKLKNFPKRLKALRTYAGKMLGGKVLAGLMLNRGLIVAMNVTEDGEANDAPLTIGLLEQFDRSRGGLLFMADRQFCDSKIPNWIEQQQCRFVIRYSKKMQFLAENTCVLQDSRGRKVIDADGNLGTPSNKNRMFMRMVTLVRPGEEDVAIVTNLRDVEKYPAEELLDLYLQRWSIERVFQQITEVFHLEKFIGGTPRSAVFQFALCALLYNIIQIVRRYIAEGNQRPVETLSSEMIFRDAHDQMTATALLAETDAIVEATAIETPIHLRQRLTCLLALQWSPLWIKTGKHAKKNDGTALPKKRVPGNHASAWKLIQAARQTHGP